MDCFAGGERKSIFLVRGDMFTKFIDMRRVMAASTSVALDVTNVFIIEKYARHWIKRKLFS